MATERRQHPRNPSYLGGRIAFNHLHATMDCLIRNISPTGARLVFSTPAVLPDRFVLSVPSREQALNVRIAWRSEMEAGVAFEAPEPVRQIVSLEMARKIRRLEDERKDLQRRIDELSGSS